MSRKPATRQGEAPEGCLVSAEIGGNHNWRSSMTRYNTPPTTGKQPAGAIPP